MALARSLFEATCIQDAKDPTAVFDQPLFFESPGCYRNRRTSTSEHVREKFLRYFESVGVSSIAAKQQPFCKPLLHVVLGITSRRLGRLDELRLNVAQHQCLESVTTTKLLPSGLDLTTIAGTFDLCVDTKETELCPHQCGYTDR